MMDVDVSVAVNNPEQVSAGEAILRSLKSNGIDYLFINPGMLRRVFPAWLSFFRKDFHPWQHDNRDLIRAWEQQQASPK